ncbi:MAG TPA: 3'-5' exonuclease, partial [Saprospiraceae bacterium]|nr:3'-5' exonuclease [Saprospiraceae bacterium]
LMSVHAAKGLEFKSVFVVGMEEKLFPSFMSLDSHDGIEEERRLFYVAITRAEQFLTLSYAENRYRYGQMRVNEASRFLEEMPRQHVESTAALGLAKAAERGSRDQSPQQASSGVSGAFPKRTPPPARPVVDPAGFKPSAPDTIQVGMQVLHLQFGQGEVIAIDGHKDSRMASIRFGAGEAPKRIMLKFAKLQVVEG